MRHLMVLVFSLVATVAVASDDTQKLLDAPRVKDVLRFEVDRGKDATTVSFRADDHFGGVVHEGDTFATPGTILLTYKLFNPFRVTTAAAEAVAPDPNQKAIGDFVDALTGLGKAIVPSTKVGALPSGSIAATAAGANKDCLDLFDTCTKEAEMELRVRRARAGLAPTDKLTDDLKAFQDDATKRCQARIDECARCGAFNAAVATAMHLATSAPAPKVTADDLQVWVEKANGRSGILLVRDDEKLGVKAKRQQVQNVISTLQGAKDQLIALATAPDMCRTNVATLTSLFTAEGLDQLIIANQRLLASLDAIIKMLDDYAGRKWRDGDTKDSDLIFATVEGDPAQQKTVTLTFRVQNLAIDKATNTVSLTTDVEAKRAIVVRRYRVLVPEVGVAGIYNDVRYPKYSAVKAADGTFTVGKTTDTSNVDAAITMNLLCNCVGGSFLYPGIQLGVSKAKDYPGILGGIVLRFASPKQLSFAIGRMITWYKDLDGTYTVNGPVPSDADLQAHLARRRAPTALYLAAQYNF